MKENIKDINLVWVNHWLWQRGGWTGKMTVAVILRAFILGLAQFCRRLLF